MITGIKRKKTAIESTFRYFQTIDLILSHFKREADKLKIFELVEKKPTLKDLLIATASVHIYHNYGIRVGELVDFNKGTFEYSKILEVNEKKTIYKEIRLLLNNSFESEIALLYKLIELEDKFLDLLINLRKKDINESEKELLLNEIDKYLEKEILDIILHFSPYNFYDLIGDLIGLTDIIKVEVLEKSAELRDISVELEKRLQLNEKEDKNIELSTLIKIKNSIQTKFEFKSYQELKMNAMSVRMIKKKIMEYDLNRFPVSIQGLKAFKNANKIKKTLIRIIENALETEIDYDIFENKVFDYLKKEIILQFRTNPNDFIYFLQNINEQNFREIIYILNKYGIFNILHIMNMDEEIVRKIKDNMVRYNINKFDILQLNDQKKNILSIAKNTLLKIYELNVENNIRNEKKNLDDLLKMEKSDNEKLWDVIERKINISFSDLRDFKKKKDVIDDIFLKDLDLNNYSQILFSLDFEEILNKIVKDIYFFILSKILRQLSRIIEAYNKISDEKALYLLALKKMYNTNKSEEWIWIKLEELLINRLKKRQKELVLIFNADNKPFLVNGFILARLIDSSLEKTIKIYNNSPSPIYQNVKDIKLSKDLISPISYCLGYDLIKRFEQFEELKRHTITEEIKLKEQKIENKKILIREKQKTSTLNWIERRITSSLMRINSPGINPNQLYWQEKDTKTTTENIKLHCELEGNNIERLTEFFLFAIDKIKSLTPEIKLPDQNIVKNDIKKNIEQILENRPTQKKEDITSIELYDGEKYEISKIISKKIGKFLDKALYLKFKSKVK
ncbi:MAG: hypothetical protein JXA99_00615 [Candidatus Lokiarchaeota archaeon]|nr:hypothetical protein [Candidatus Lokiarchaeota archaeon]